MSTAAFLIICLLVVLLVGRWVYEPLRQVPLSQSIPIDEDKPIAKLMDEHNLPKPSGLMAGMLALRIARIPAAREYAKTRDLFLPIPIKEDQQVIEVRLSSVQRNSGVVWSVTVGLPGSNGGKGYLSVDLTRGEQLEIANQMLELMKRSREMVAVEQEGDSQHAALTILENLL